MIRRLLPLAALAIVAGGCANYRIGTTLPPHLRAVYVPSVINRSPEPGIDTTATGAVLREIQREGTLALTAEHAAATRLDIAVVRFRLEPVRYLRDDTRTPDEFRAVVVADVTFRSRHDGKVLFQGAVEGEADIPVGMDLISAKQAHLPRACEDLARKIVERCLSVW